MLSANVLVEAAGSGVSISASFTWAELNDSVLPSNSWRYSFGRKLAVPVVLRRNRQHASSRGLQSFAGLCLWGYSGNAAQQPSEGNRRAQQPQSEEVMACEKTLLANKICAMALRFEADKVKLED